MGERVGEGEEKRKENRCGGKSRRNMKKGERSGRERVDSQMYINSE